MAALGDPARFAPAFNKLVMLKPHGRYRTFRTAMVFKPGYCDHFLAAILGIPKRSHHEPLTQIHFDLAAALQAKLEEVLFSLVRRLRELSSSRNLCLAGGVFLNSVANGKIRRSGLFDRVHIPPVPGDHGAALGAAASAYYALSGAQRRDMHFTPFAGPAYSEQEIEAALHAAAPNVHHRRSDNIADDTAELLAKGQIIGWFQGGAEYGPRALGHRSILADPRRADMKDLVNERIKHREQFRPFAGAIPLEVAPRYFEVGSDGGKGESPYMQFVVPVTDEGRKSVPAVVHNGTCRVQTVAREADPLFHQLLESFGSRTGVPIVLNTSFNDRDEPIVCSPADAVRTFLKTDLDALAIGPFLVTKKG
ncbi:MAG: carbamoyltransferase C-terminal domain-containing protein [Phycisphaerales bacterium]